MSQSDLVLSHSAMTETFLVGGGRWGAKASRTPNLYLVLQRVTQLLNGEVTLSSTASSSSTAAKPSVECLETASPSPSEQVEEEDQAAKSSSSSLAAASTAFPAPLREALSQLLPVIKVSWFMVLFFHGLEARRKLSHHAHH